MESGISRRRWVPTAKQVALLETSIQVRGSNPGYPVRLDRALMLTRGSSRNLWREQFSQPTPFQRLLFGNSSRFNLELTPARCKTTHAPPCASRYMRNLKKRLALTLQHWHVPAHTAAAASARAPPGVSNI